MASSAGFQLLGSAGSQLLDSGAAETLCYPFYTNHPTPSQVPPPLPPSLRQHDSSAPLLSPEHAFLEQRVEGGEEHGEAEDGGIEGVDACGRRAASRGAFKRM
jgi:hypothetical protein